MAGIVVGAASALCFLAAAVLSSAPVVGTARLPDAADVRAVDSFYNMLQVLALAPEPLATQFSIETGHGAQRMIAHAKADKRADLVLTETRATVRVSSAVASRTWINLALSLDERADGGTPVIGLHIGTLKLPQPLTDAIIAGVSRLGSDPSAAPLTLEQILPRFAVDPRTITVTGRLPPQILGVAQLLGGRSGGLVDPDIAFATYGALLAQQVREPELRFQRIAGLAVAGAEGRSDLASRLFALEMLVNGPWSRRFMGLTDRSAPCPIEAVAATLHGRADLPKHLSLSAAISLGRDARVAEAMGLWKELRDSLPGGSGWSFVDLAANRAGLTLAAMTRDGDWKTMAQQLVEADALTLLPRAALDLPETIPDPEFRENYGGLGDPRLGAMQGNIDRILRGSPLYAPATGEAIAAD